MPSATGIETEGVWQEDDCAVWTSRLHSYDKAIASLGDEKLTNLDNWFRNELPIGILKRDPHCIYADDLQGIAAWKMHRGVWRERNRVLVAGNNPESVEAVSREAYAAVSHELARGPVATLSTLAGVGPATASAALAAYAPHVYPFFDELVAAFIPDLGPVAFTIPYYMKYAAALRERASLLNKLCSNVPPSGWTAHDVAQALWAYGTLQQARSET